MTRYPLLLRVALATLAPLAGCGAGGANDASTADASAPDRQDAGTNLDVTGDDAATGDDLAGDGSSLPAVTDAGSDARTDAGTRDSGATVLPQLAGTVLWLEAMSGVALSGAAVTGWEDQSEAHNDAAQTVSQFQPTMIVRSGLPALQFSGKSPANPKNTGGSGGPYLVVKDAASLDWGKDDFTLAIVAAYRNPIDASHDGVEGFFFGKYGKAAGQVQIIFAGNWPQSEGPNIEHSNLFFGFGEPAGVKAIVTPQTGFNDDQVRLYVAQRTSTATVVRVSGQIMETLPSTTVIDVSSVGADVGIGNFGGDKSGGALDGDVFAVVAVHGVTSADDLAKLETYLMTTYPVTPPPH